MNLDIAIYLPLFVMLLGLALWAIAKGMWADMGRIMFAAGLLVALFMWAGLSGFRKRVLS